MDSLDRLTRSYILVQARQGWLSQLVIHMTGNSTSQSPTRTAEQEQAAYRLGRVVVTPASADEPAAYQHSDLRRGRTP